MTATNCVQFFLFQVVSGVVTPPTDSKFGFVAKTLSCDMTAIFTTPKSVDWI